MASSITSAPTFLETLTMASYSISWTGTTPVGTISLQTSNDATLDSAGQLANSGTWNTAPLQSGGASVSSIPISGNSGSGMIEILATGVNAVRLVYTATSGTGTLAVKFVGKVS